jgi:hypothetical protein
LCAAVLLKLSDHGKMFEKLIFKGFSELRDLNSVVLALSYRLFALFHLFPLLFEILTG